MSNVDMGDKPKGDKPTVVPSQGFINDVMNVAYLHEDKFKPMACVLCGETMNSIHETHNPHPLTKSTVGVTADGKQETIRCCADCNATRVFPARLQLMLSGRGQRKTPSPTPTLNRAMRRALKHQKTAMIPIEELVSIPSYDENREGDDAISEIRDRNFKKFAQEVNRE